MKPYDLNLRNCDLFGKNGENGASVKKHAFFSIVY